MVKVNKDFAFKVLSIVDKGLTSGLGNPKPGQMCVEAAVAYASGEPHSDSPTCVDPVLASLKISLNDNDGWADDKSRAKGLRRIAIAQLGSVKKFKTSDFEKQLSLQWAKYHNEFVEAAKKKIKIKLPKAPNIQAVFQKDHDKVTSVLSDYIYDLTTARDDFDDLMSDLPDYSKLCDMEEIASELSAYYLQDKSDDHCLALAAEMGVQALIKMKMPGTKFLYLTEKKKRKSRRK